MIYDIIVIGGGPAGLTAATYARRAGKSVLVIEKNAFGGQITWSPKVENFPAFVSISGSELGDKLLALGPGRIVITGIITEDKVRTVDFDGTQTFVCDRPRLTARYPGTGDIFAATLLGKLLAGKPFRTAVEEACAFVSHTIAYTLAAPETPRREGVLLEGCLGELIER